MLDKHLDSVQEMADKITDRVGPFTYLEDEIRKREWERTTETRCVKSVTTSGKCVKHFKQFLSQVFLLRESKKKKKEQRFNLIKTNIQTNIKTFDERIMYYTNRALESISIVTRHDYIGKIWNQSENIYRSYIYYKQNRAGKNQQNARTVSFWLY